MGRALLPAGERGFAGGSMPMGSGGQVTLCDTSDAARIVLDMPMKSTVRDLKEALVKELQQGCVADVRICFKVGSTFAAFEDTEQVFKGRKKRTYYYDVVRNAGGIASEGPEQQADAARDASVAGSENTGEDLSLVSQDQQQPQNGEQKKPPTCACCTDGLWKLSMLRQCGGRQRLGLRWWFSYDQEDSPPSPREMTLGGLAPAIIAMDIAQETSSGTATGSPVGQKLLKWPSLNVSAKKENSSGNATYAPMTWPSRNISTEEETSSGTATYAPMKWSPRNVSADEEISSGTATYALMKSPSHNVSAEEETSSGTATYAPMKWPSRNVNTEEESSSGTAIIYAPMKWPSRNVSTEEETSSGTATYAPMKWPSRNIGTEEETSSGTATYAPMKWPSPKVSTEAAMEDSDSYVSSYESDPPGQKLLKWTSATAAVDDGDMEQWLNFAREQDAAEQMNADVFEPASPRGRSQNEPWSPHTQGQDLSPRRRRRRRRDASRFSSQGSRLDSSRFSSQDSQYSSYSSQGSWLDASRFSSQGSRLDASRFSSQGSQRRRLDASRFCSQGSRLDASRFSSNGSQASSQSECASPSISGRRRGRRIPGSAVSSDSAQDEHDQMFDFNALDRVIAQGNGAAAPDVNDQQNDGAQELWTRPCYGDDEMFDFDILHELYDDEDEKQLWAATPTRRRWAACLRKYGFATDDMGDESARIALVSNGSAGDVQPLVALALALERCRHNVCLFVPVNLVGECTRHGINAVAVFGHIQECIRRMGGMESSGKDRDNWIHQLKRSKQELDKWFQENPGVCVNVSDALADFDPEAIVFGSQCEGPVLRHSHKHGVPAIPVFFNRLDMETHDYTRMRPPRPILYAVSAEIDPEPRAVGRWPKRVGPLYVKEDVTTKTHLANLRTFLQSGSAPVAMGWGSMQPARITPSQLLGRCIRVLMIVGRRGVILGGWFGLDQACRQLIEDNKLNGFEDGAELAAYARSQVYFIDAAPHDWLLTKCCCLVHHGGAGSVEAALRAGCPQVITPIWHDQFDAATRIMEMKAGHGFSRPLPEVAESSMAGAIKAAMTCKLEPVKRDTSKERAANAANLIDIFLKVDVKTGAWANNFWALQRPRDA